MFRVVIRMNINYSKCKDVILLLNNYYQNQDSLATIEYPVNITCGTIWYAF